MKRLAVSATYTAAAFLAALAVVVLVVRSSAAAEQAKFFYFQAIYFILTTVISQFLTLSTFRGMPARRAGYVADALALAVVLVFLQLPPGMDFSLGETALYALASVLLYRGSALIVLVQYYSFNGLGWVWVPALTLAARVAAAFAGAPGGPALMFLLNGCAAFLVPLAVLSVGRLKANRARENSTQAKAHDSLPLFLFLLVGSMTFLWERILYAFQNNTDGLLATGYVMTVVLPPLSALFATLYRANAREVFGEAPGHDLRHVLRQTALPFVAISVTYLAVVAVIWGQVMAYLGALVVPPLWLALLLGAAIILDRLANLLVFLAPARRAYGVAACGKGGLVVLAAGSAGWLGLGTPQVNYLVFFSAAVAYFAGIAIWHRRHAA